jgi:hypothetical protein
MTLPAEEFIRRFLLHVLPSGFHRIRYCGFMGSRYRAENLETCRRLLHMSPRPPSPTESPSETTHTADHRDHHEALTGASLRQCPVCKKGHMVVVKILAPLNPTHVPVILRRAPLLSLNTRDKALVEAWQWDL